MNDAYLLLRVRSDRKYREERRGPFAKSKTRQEGQKE